MTTVCRLKTSWPSCANVLSKMKLTLLLLPETKLDPLLPHKMKLALLCSCTAQDEAGPPAATQNEASLPAAAQDEAGPPAAA